MKIRNGFISNSSTSSFIVVGFKIDSEGNTRLYEEVIRNRQLMIVALDRLSFDDPEQFIFGYRIVESVCQQELPNSQTDLNTIIEYKNKIAREYNINQHDIKLYSGTYRT